MSAPHHILTRLANQPQRRVRIRHPWGHGNWHDASEAASLQATCDHLNTVYGAGTHYLEWDS